MLSTESSGSVRYLQTGQELDEIPLGVYRAFDADDENGTATEDRASFGDAIKCFQISSADAECEASTRYRHLSGDRDEEQELGEASVVAPMAARVLGSASRCLAKGAEQLDPDIASGPLPRVQPHNRGSSALAAINSRAKVIVIVLCFFCGLAVLNSHFNSSKANVLEGEVKRLQSEKRALEIHAELLKKEREDLSGLLLEPGKKKRLINMMQRSRAFDQFIRRNGFETTPQNTKSVQQCLGEIIRRFNIQSILDIPCGDASWQHSIDGVQDVLYVGADINPTALEAAKRRPENRDMEFMLFDAVHFPLRRSFDLVVFRDILEQQRIQDTLTAILNFNLSGSRYIAATYWPDSPAEANEAGYRLHHAGWYEANLLHAPFDFKEPLYSCNNVDANSKYWGKSKLGVWRLRDLQVTRRRVLEAERAAHQPHTVAWDLPQAHVRQIPTSHEVDVPVNDLLKFFGLGIPGSPVQVTQWRPNGEQSDVTKPAGVATPDPFEGLFSNFLETRGPVRASRVPHRPILLKELFDLPDFKPVSGP